MLRKVEQALLSFKLPGAIPQVVNENTIKVPIAKYAVIHYLSYNI